MAGTWSAFIEDYLKRGFSDIVVVDYSHEEERHGYNNETTMETIVAKRGGKFVYFRISSYQDFNPHRPSRDVTPGAEIEISEAEYRNESRGKPILETAAVQEKLSAITELAQVTPRCPNHHDLFVVRTNSKTRVRFWGCPSFPKCQVTQPMTGEQLRLHMIATRPLA